MADENKTPEQWRKQITSHALPGETTKRPWEGMNSEEGYEIAAETLAHLMLIVSEADPKLLDVSARSSWEAASNEKLLEAVKARWPEWDDWCGGVSGFQFGWAHNIVRYILGVSPTGNPAVMTIG